MALRGFVDGALFAESAGDGPPAVVLLHGWGRDRHDFDGVVPLLGCPSLAFDLPGFGASPSPPAAWGSPDYADLVARALDGSGGVHGGTSPVRAVLVGHSFGGGVALCLAAARPDLVSGLVLTGVPRLRRRSPGKPAPAFRLGRALHRRGLLSEARMEWLRHRYGSADYRAATGVMRQVLVRVLAESYEEQLAGLGCPVAMVWGADDTAAPLAVAREACSTIAGCDLQAVDGVGHDLPRERPELLARCVTSLVERVAR